MKSRMYADWKRDGVAGTYLVEILQMRDGRAKIRPLRHNWYPHARYTQRARWVAVSRLRELREKP